jgi:DNA replication protein DnaC
MNQQIETSLKELRLSGMARSWQSLCETRRVKELGLSEGLEILLHSEQEERQNNRYERLLKGAKFRYQASIPEINFEPSRGLDKELLSDLSSCRYIDNGESILITGATGCGKSFLASALGHQACMNGYKVMYFNTQKFMIRIKMSRLDGSLLNFFDKIAKCWRNRHF